MSSNTSTLILTLGKEVTLGQFYDKLTKVINDETRDYLVINDSLFTCIVDCIVVDNITKTIELSFSERDGDE